MSDDKDEIDDLIREIDFLSKLGEKCPQILQSFGTYGSGSSTWLVMEHCAGGSCNKLTASQYGLSEEIVLYILQEAFKGATFLHKQNVMHRDFKGQNLLITSQGEVKVCDFGVSAQVSMMRGTRSTFTGSFFWMAPEVVQCQDPKLGNRYSSKVDVWSLGITALELAHGVPPHEALHPYDALQAITNSPSPKLNRPEKFPRLNQILPNLLNKDPSGRSKASHALSLISRIRKDEAVSGSGGGDICAEKLVNILMKSHSARMRQYDYRKGD
eukprot:Lithocolla_globosa_v1_NODE_2645_length_1921_cov_8.660772.p1 type:complete len:270 gc:universal NODE_2645_length_1921_cov_8.660772:832-1641(+)